MRVVIRQRRSSLFLRLLWTVIIISGFALLIAIPAVTGYLYLSGRLP